VTEDSFPFTFSVLRHSKIVANRCVDQPDSIQALVDLISTIYSLCWQTFI